MVRLFSIAAVAVLSALTFAAPSQALSCLRPTPERSFAQFNDAPELYQIWSGRWIQTNPIPEVKSHRFTTSPGRSQLIALRERSIRSLCRSACMARSR